MIKRRVALSSTTVRENFERVCEDNPMIALSVPLAVRADDGLPVAVRDYTPPDRNNKVNRAYCPLCLGPNAKLFVARHGHLGLICQSGSCHYRSFSYSNETDSLMRAMQRVYRDNAELVDAFKVLILDQAMTDYAETHAMRQSVYNMAKTLPNELGEIDIDPNDTTIRRFKKAGHRVGNQNTVKRK